MVCIGVCCLSYIQSVQECQSFLNSVDKVGRPTIPNPEYQEPYDQHIEKEQHQSATTLIARHKKETPPIGGGAQVAREGAFLAILDLRATRDYLDNFIIVPLI